MRSFTPRSAKWLRVPIIGGVATALALVGGIALGAPQGNAPQVSTSAPDPTSFLVFTNGSPLSTVMPIGVLCFDKTINGSAAAVAGAAADVKLVAYDGTHTLASNLTSTAATVNPSNGACIDLTYPAGSDLNSFTLATVTRGAVVDSLGRQSVPGAVGVTPTGTPEITPLAGETTGAKLIGITKNPATPNVITYVFNRFLDPGTPGAGAFRYVASNGTMAQGQSTVQTGNTVAVTFPAAVLGDVRYSVAENTVNTQTQRVPNPYDAIGAPVASNPTIVSATPSSSLAGAFNVTFDQQITSAVPTKFIAYLEDNTKVGGATITPINSTTLQVSFPSTAKYATKVVKIVDLGGAVNQNGTTGTSGTNPSILSEAATATPPMQSGFTTGPVLTGVTLNPTAGTATYTFDGHGGQVTPVAGGFTLVNTDGSVSAPATAAISGPNSVVVTFGSAGVAAAVGGSIAPGAVKDPQGSLNVGPETAGNGLATTTTSTTGTKPPPPPPVTTTTTTQTTRTTINPPPPRRRFNVKRVIIHAHKRRVAHHNTLVTFNGTVVVPGFLNKSRVCYGKIHLTFKHGGRVVATGNRGVSRRCTFRGSKLISNRKLHNDGGRLYARFSGNGRLFARGGASTGF
ncbi:MAG: hypothetical protein ACR2QA_12010 [Solirubrobacteraceae bacterium]